MKPELSYIRSGDYWIPDLRLESTEQRPLNKYGRMRRTFLREHNPTQYNILAMQQKLFPICGRFRKPRNAGWSRSWKGCWHRIRALTKQQTSLAGCSTGTV